MNDRELLELAAKAAGFFYHGARIGSDYQNCYVSTTNDSEDWFVWAPQDDDGDALRLAVKLGMEVYIDNHPDGCACTEVREFIKNGSCLVNHHGDAAAATRRAIVIVAAAIGEKQ